MKNDAVRYFISFAVLLLVILNLAAACTQPQPNTAPVLPKPRGTQPPAASENQSATETGTPPANQAVNEETWYPVETFTGEIDETTPVFHIYGTEWHLTWTIDADNLEKAVLKLVIYPKDQPYAIWQTVSNSGGSTGTLNYFLSNVDKRDFFIKVTAQNLRHWTIAIEDNANAATSYPIKITFIHYKGTVFLPDPENGICFERVEPDEYVVIKNLSTCYQDMTGWTLKNISKPSPTFKFPPMIIMPGGVIRIYTDEYHEETGGLTFYYGYGDIWSNDNSDIAVLYDELGNEVSRKSYTIPMELNETGE
ncbi:MAG: lamin tail domain-containing protein [Dehalococcoidia bacterium]|nr:lamin tail domain-containing protein [Dehalococcoidia bacterium]